MAVRDETGAGEGASAHRHARLRVVVARKFEGATYRSLRRMTESERAVAPFRADFSGQTARKDRIMIAQNPDELRLPGDGGEPYLIGQGQPFGAAGIMEAVAKSQNIFWRIMPY